MTPNAKKLLKLFAKYQTARDYAENGYGRYLQHPSGTTASEKGHEQWMRRTDEATKLADQIRALLETM